VVSGVGYQRAAETGASASRFHEIRVVVTNKAVLDFATPDHAMRVRSVHPGVTVDEVVEATGFPLVVPEDVADSRLPTAEELRLVREVLDPTGLRRSEVK
jgi:acyl CoA:acetate/3-ketoacid CoA transferase beta subunit